MDSTKTRKQRQIEYETNLDKWAEMGEKRYKFLKTQSKKFAGYPYWYTEFSLLQLKNLKGLQDNMFKDNEEQTTFRTLKALYNIGMINDISKGQIRKIKRLINEYNTDSIKFLYEIYKSISGNYFDNEPIKFYSCRERIILSGIAFLELPKIILELHKRLPPIIKIKFPPKPKPPQVIRTKKMFTPLLEKLILPPDWRLYRKQLFKWRKKCLSIVRPVAILPKKEKIVKENISIDDKKGNFCKSLSNNASTKYNETCNSEENMDNCMQEAIDNQDTDDNTDTYLPDVSCQDFSPNNDWTDPPSPCPYKYRKLMNKVGPVNTDKTFFDELGYENEKKSYPAGRENLSVNMQSYLLDLETDLFKVTDDVDKLTCKVGSIAKEILDSDPTCDPCCVCRQTQKTYQKSRTTKAPYMMIDSIQNNKDNKTQVIGATAMHSPASSISSFGEPPCIPSSEKLVKNMIITGTTTTIDGEKVKQVEGVTKFIEHVPREILLPDPDMVDIKNVPPCECAKEDEDTEADLQLINEDKNKDMCYGRKFRPDEGPTYTCPEFKKKEAEEEFEYTEPSEKFVNECGFGINFQKCSADYEGEYETSIKSEFEAAEATPEIKCNKCLICKRCGKKVEAKCRYNEKKNVNKKIKYLNTIECSCTSLSEFLKFNIEKISCKRNFSRNMITKSASLKSKKLSRKSSICKRFPLNDECKKEYKPRISNKSIEASFNFVEEENDYADQKLRESIQKETIDVAIERILNACDSIQNKQDGPFGLRTSSEEALPVERTIAYLVPQHPPDHPAGQIPVGEGKRPCRCRENRNNQKTLLYNIGGLADGKNEKEESVPRVIEGVTFITPEPSIRRSEEYIPEYELYDSPYQNLCATKSVKRKCDCTEEGEVAEKKLVCGDEKEDPKNKLEKSRSQDWKNSFNDPYLTEMFTNKDRKICYNKCSKLQKKVVPRKLRVMNAVCECKYERKIVKRNEDRKKWLERQNHLKSFKKKPYIHISDISRPIKSDQKSSASELTDFRTNDINCTEVKSCTSDILDESNMAPPQIVISAVTMQTPVATPSTNNSETTFASKYEKINKLMPTGNNLSMLMNQSLCKSSTQNENVKDKKINLNADESKNITSIKSKSIASKYNKSTKSFNIKVGSNKWDTMQDQAKGSQQFAKRRKSFYDRLEQELKVKLREELDKMIHENFISVKLPSYYKMPQLLYWISYRTKGMHYTEKYKRELTKKSMVKWSSLKERIMRKLETKHLVVQKKDFHKLNFNYAIYWKKKIAKYKTNYYRELRYEMVNLGREVWPTMEFGKFPDIIFKQAYFTYLPSKEKNTHVVKIYYE